MLNNSSLMKLQIISYGIVTTILLGTTSVLAEKKPPATSNTSTNSPALSEFKRCSVPAAALPKDCDDTRKQIVRIKAVIKLYQKGNKAVLADLVSGAIDSDSYLGETYGDFFATVVLKQPNDFLQAVSSRQPTDRETLYRITALSLPDGQVSKVTKNLKQLVAQKSNKFSAVAQEFLTEIQNSR
jgi:hypothetical protein